MLNTCWYGVPQSRERIIFVGVREDLNVEPSHPKATVDKPITVGEALVGCPADEVPLMPGDWMRLWKRVPPGKAASHILGKNSGWPQDHSYGALRKLDPRRPALTMTKMQTGRGFATMVHWAEPRAVSISEAKRLMSFPDDFEFFGSYQDQWARIGNSVPPKFMEAIARHVKEEILDTL